jgi:TetR/AcrR family transcriptional repressor of bet genes
MLKETLAYLRDEYRAGWEAALKDGEADPEKRLRDLIEFDLGTAVCSERRVAVWYAFWGSVRTKALYREVCLPSDRDYVLQIADTVRELERAENRSGIDSDAVARGYSAIVIGQWQHLNVAPEDFDRKEAKAVSRDFFRSFFSQRVR